MRYIKNWKGYVATLNYGFNQQASAKVGYAFKGTPVEIYHGAVAPASKTLRKWNTNSRRTMPFPRRYIEKKTMGRIYWILGK